MLEKDIENLIANYPEEFFPGEGFKLVGQQVKLGNCRADILFKDKHDRTIIVEVKRGILTREAAGQIMEYYGLIKNQSPDSVVELILCANTIPHERRQFLENVGIECKELGLSLIPNIAKKYNYKFLDTQEIKKEDINLVKESNNTYSSEGLGRVWIFQANPSRYNIIESLSDSEFSEDGWTVNQYKDEIKKGDKAIIWVSGKEAGIYAIADVVSDPHYYAPTPEEEKYWINEEDKGIKRLLVDIVVKKKMINNPIFRNKIQTIDGLKNLSILKMPQATNFPVTEAEWEVIKELVEKT